MLPFQHRCGRALVRAVALGAVVAWAAVIPLGFWALHAYEVTPGASGRGPSAWPATAKLRRAPGQDNIVMAVHPRCPCTRASLESLGEILRLARREAAVRLLVFRPEGAEADWAGPSLQGALAAVPGAAQVDDPGGREAARFGLATSGAVAVFGASGRKRYCGGLTSARGRPELSEGGAAVLAILAGDPARRARAKVFGCALHSSTTRDDEP